MELLAIILILLLVTRAFGEVALRFGQPVLVGELVGGIVLGVCARQFESSLPVLSDLPNHEVFRALSDLGVFFLMLYAGMEMHPRDLVGASKKALAIAVGTNVQTVVTGQNDSTVIGNNLGRLGIAQILVQRHRQRTNARQSCCHPGARTA